MKLTELAKLAGFEFVNHSKWSDAVALEAGEGYFVYPDHTTKKKLPEFPHSLDACFRWLPEPLRKKYEVVIFIDPIEDATFSKVGVRGIFKDIEYWERAEWLPWLDPKTPSRTYLEEVATALCKVVERLMAKEVCSNG